MDLKAIKDINTEILCVLLAYCSRLKGVSITMPQTATIYKDSQLETVFTTVQMNLFLGHYQTVIEKLKSFVTNISSFAQEIGFHTHTDM